MAISTIMAIVAVIMLLIHWKGPNAVWVGAMIGAIIGVIVALIKGDWGLFATIFAIGTFIGTIIERAGGFSKRKH